MFVSRVDFPTTICLHPFHHVIGCCFVYSEQRYPKSDQRVFSIKIFRKFPVATDFHFVLITTAGSQSGFI